MELNRRVLVRISVILLLLSGHAAALPGVNLNLNCTNDFHKLMSCELLAPNCSEYSVTLLNDQGNGEKNCTFQQCGLGRCCCSVQMLMISGESHTAKVWKGGKPVESKHIDVIRSIKPKPPTIISVDGRNGKVMWNANTYYKTFHDSLTAEVTYYKKGDKKGEAEKRPERITPVRVNGLDYYEIPGRDLEPSTTYVVSVRTHTSWSNMSSDRSNQTEFSTPASPNSLLLAVIISLSIAAVILSAAIYGCYVKSKRKWWDPVAKCPNPKLLTMHPSEQEVLKPVPSIISSVCIEPIVSDDSKPWLKMSLSDTSSGSLQQSSGISTGSSCLSYADTEPVNIKASVQDAVSKAFPNISPISLLTTSPFTGIKTDSAPYSPCGGRADEMNSGSSSFVNKTYSILIPSCSHQIMADTSEVQMLCDSAYHPSESNTVTCSDQQVPAFPVPAQLAVILPPVASSPVPTDMSYQQCNADSGSFSYAEDSSSASIASGTNATPACDLVSKAEAGCESSDDVVSGATKLNGQSEEATLCDKNPSSVPAGHSFPAVENNSQAFQNLVGRPNVLSSEQSDKMEEHLDNDQGESFTKTPQGLFSPVVPGVQSGQNLSELQTPFLPLLSADKSMPMMVDSGYLCN